MNWHISYRLDRDARVMADRHYSRKTHGHHNFSPPGRLLVLVGVKGKAYWTTSWPFAEYTKHAWAGAWLCSAFRNEGEGLSSDLIRQAVAATRWKFGDPPDLGMITFVDEGKVRKKRDPGRCFLRAGFVHAGYTKGGLLALQLMPENVPPAEKPVGVLL